MKTCQPLNMQRIERGPVVYFSEEAKLADKKNIRRALKRNGSITKTAASFGVARNTLLNRMDALDIRNGNGKR